MQETLVLLLYNENSYVEGLGKKMGEEAEESGALWSSR